MSGDCSDGFGIFLYSSGSKYEGEWKNSRRSGRGSFCHANGTDYEGTYLNDVPHGSGTVTMPDGRRKRVVYDSGRLVESRRLEIETVSGGMKYGEFSMNGNYRGWFFGDMISGYKPHGKGVMKFQSGSRYEGSWENGKIHGRGLMVWENGSRYEGEWRAGKRSGYGTYIWPDGSKYEGAWSENRRNGRGTYTDKKGSAMIGTWKDDVFIK